MTDDLDVLLDRLRADLPPMSDDAFDAGRARLRAATQPREAVIIRLPLPERPVSPTSRRVSWLVAAVLMIAAVTAGVLVVRHDNIAPAEQPSQPPVIRVVGGLPTLPPNPVNAAGDLAAVVSELVVPPGQYVYLRLDMESRPSRGEPVKKSVIEMWLPAEAGQEMMVRNTEPGLQPQETRSPRVDHPSDPPLAATPAAQYVAMRAHLGTALDAPEQARDELLMPLTSPVIGAAERKLRLATLGLLPKVEVRHEQLADGAPAFVISAVEYGGASRTDVFFDPATGYVMQTQTVELPGAANPSIRLGDVIRYTKPVVVPSVGAIP